MRQLILGASMVPALLAFTEPARAVTSAEFYQTQAAVYGRYEARIRFAAGDGVVSSFFLWKAGSETAGAFWNELDFEKLGADCHVQTNAIFGAPNVGHPQVNAVSDACGGYHTYGFEWTPTYISWLVDGAEVRRDSGATATAFAQNATDGMQIHFNIWPGDASFGGNFSPAILPVYQYISWVQYSSFENGSFTRKWREEFDSATVPSGWVTGNWASPKNLSTHSPANVSFVNGISILSLTSDNATGFTGTPPTDVASGGSGAGGTSGAAGGAGGSTANAGGAGGSAVNAGGAAPGAGGQNAGNGGTAGVSNTGTGGTQPNGSGGTAVNPGNGGSGNGAQAGTGATPSDANGSCSCRLPSSGHSSGSAGGVALAALFVLAARRRSAKSRR
jgi:MYXO-CTERM domain-containing protein